MDENLKFNKPSLDSMSIEDDTITINRKDSSNTSFFTKLSDQYAHNKSQTQFFKKILPGLDAFAMFDINDQHETSH